MEPHVMLLCKYMDCTAVFKVLSNSTFKDLVEFVCGKWKNLDSDSISVSYCLDGHPKCMIDDDSDFQNMLLLVHSFRIDRVDITIDEIGDSDACSRNIVESHASGSNDIDTEMDLLPIFCPHQETNLLSAGWVNGIKHVGQKFVGGASEFRNTLCKYAIEIGFQFRYVKNDKSQVTAECSMRESKGCLWRVYASVEKANGFFYIRTLHGEHSCGAAVRTSKNSRMSSDLVSSLIVDQIRSKPQARAIDVVRDFNQQYGLTITYNHAWLGIEKARKEIFGDYSLSYDAIRWYMDSVMSTNPGSYLDLEYNHESGRFKRFFVAFNASIEGFSHCRPLLFLDGTFLKGKFKGNLLAATAKDGNQGIFPIAIGVVDSETIDNWYWFLEHLSKILLEDRTITFISDRNGGLLEALPKVFPTAYHCYCLQHLRANLRDKFSGPIYSNSFRKRIVHLFNLCAYAPTVGSFHENLEVLKDEGKNNVVYFLSNLPYDKWSNAYFKGRRYGEMCSNVAESYNSWIREARHLPIMKMVDSIRLKIMDLMSRRRELAKNWNTFLCPEMDSRLIGALKSGRTWLVSRSSDYVFEVQSRPSVTVDVFHRTCSCYQWQLNGFLCAHAATAIQKNCGDLYSHIDPFFYVSSFKSCYAKSIYPIPTVEKPDVVLEDVVVLPPLCKNPVGRPKKKRIPSKGEDIRRIKCGRCGKFGNHNRKTCKHAM